MNDRAKQRAENLTPFPTQPIKGGPKVWHGVTGTRFAMPLPEHSKGPIRARQTRIDKAPYSGVYGSPPSSPGSPEAPRRRK